MLTRIDQMRMLSGREFLKQKEYWQTKFSAAMTNTEVPYSRIEQIDKETVDIKKNGETGAPLTQSFYEFAIRGEPFAKARKLSKESDVSLYIILLAALKILLHRYSGNTDITVVSPLYQPNITAETLNDFLLIRDEINGEKTFRDILVALRSSVLEAYENQDYPFDKFLQYLYSTEKPMDYTRLSTVRCSLEGIHKPFAPPAGAGTLDVTFRKQEAAIATGISWDPGSYDTYLVEQMADHYSNILRAVLENINAKISLISMLSQQEREKLNAFNGKAVEYPRTETVTHYIERYAAESPEAEAVVMGDTGLTYRRLHERSSRLAGYLRRRGVGPDTPVGILLTRTPQMVESIAAVWKAGGAYIPIEPDDPPQRILEILKSSGAPVLLTRQEYVENYPDRVYEGTVVCLDTEAAEIEQSEPMPPIAEFDMNGLAYIIYTSGSTGKPKGAMVEHIGMMNHIWAKINDLQITKRTILAQNSSHTFDISVWQFFAAIVQGGKTVIYPNEVIMEPRQLMKQVQNHDLTLLEVVPSYLNIILNMPETGTSELNSLTYLLVTGETVKPELVDQWFRRYPGIPMVNAYGPTEASDDITHYIMNRPPGKKRIPIGRPIQNLNIYILDDYMNPCPVGIRGEICVSGVGVGRGYLKDEERTSEVFGHDPFAAGKNVRFYKTGDLGCWQPDGTIDFFGRKDFQLKIRGFRIEPGEIEEAIKQYPQIENVVVLDQEDKGGNKHLYAYIVSGNLSDIHQLREDLAGQLPDYMIPSDFILIEQIPLTANGKVDRKALKTLGTKLGTGVEHVAPKSETELKIAKIWKEILKLDELGTRDNFFDLGGTSMDIISVGSKLKEEMEHEVPVVKMYRHTTIDSLAAYLNRSRNVAEEKKQTEAARKERAEMHRRGKADRDKRRQKRERRR